MGLNDVNDNVHKDICNIETRFISQLVNKKHIKSTNNSACCDLMYIFAEKRSNMSKLPKAPLYEVVLELRWKITNKSDLTKVQYLYGDIYNILKNKYPYRESIAPPEIPMEILINQPMHRFRVAQDDYPLFQVGPGIITLNTVDDKYFWDTFSTEIEELFHSFLSVYAFQTNEKLIPSILFIDFFPFDFKDNDVYAFLSNNFNIEFKQNFIDNINNPKDVNIGFFYEISQGDLSVIFHRGKDSKNSEGIVVQTRINGISLNPDITEIKTWTDESHNVCSELFKKLTEGKLYESFKS